MILGGGSAMGLAVARAMLTAELPVVCTVRPDAPACDRPDGAVFLPLSPGHDPSDSAETLPERARDILGAYPYYLVDFLHSRFECLVAQASPDEISVWAATDIALRARCLRGLTRAMLPARAGRAVFVSSVAADRPAAGQGYYAAAKLAGEALYRATALELAGRGITTCSLRLGLLDAGRGHDYLHARHQGREKDPAARLLNLDEVTAVILFLLSPAGTAINATTLTMDAGTSALKFT